MSEEKNSNTPGNLKDREADVTGLGKVNREEEGCEFLEQPDTVAVVGEEFQNENLVKIEEIESREMPAEVKRNEDLEKINDQMALLNQRLETLSVDFNSKFKYDQHKEKIIDQLHREVQEYKNDLIKSLTRPMIMDIVHAVDDITKLVEDHQGKDPVQLDPLKLLKQMNDFALDLEDILFRQGVESFKVEQLQYDPKRQKILNTEVTNELSLDKTISRRVRFGYEWEGKVLRQEMVNVYIYKPGSESSIPETIQSKQEVEL